MKFKYYELTEAADFKPVYNESFLFFPPYALNGKPGDGLSDYSDFKVNGLRVTDYVYGSFISDGTPNILIVALSGGQYSYNKNRGFFIKGTPQQIVGVIKVVKHVISIKPNAEAKKAIKDFLSVLKPKSYVYIGQLFLHESYGYKGLSLYCDNEVITYVKKDTLDTCRIPLVPGTDYKAMLEMFLGVGEAVAFNKKNYPALVKTSTETTAQTGIQGARKILNTIKTNRDTYAKNLADITKKYVGLNRAVKLYKEKKKDIPKELLFLCEQAAKDFRSVKENFESYKGSYLLTNKNYLETKASLDFTIAKNNNAGDDFKQVNKLLEKGFIESIGYNNTEGLFWVYPPQTYKYGDADNAICFLGRVKVAINKNCNSDLPIRMWPISYPTSGGIWGTHHFGNSPGGNNICLGQFKEIIKNLVTSRQISNLIVVMKDYIQSRNEASPKHVPRFDQMSISGPAVTDDSFVVWVKSEHEKAKKTLAAMEA